MTKHEADRLALRVEQYWRRAGYPQVRAYAAKEYWMGGLENNGWGIRSNLRNGLPPKALTGKDILA